MILAPPPSPNVTLTGNPAGPSSSTASPECLRASDLCSFVYDHTHNSWLASSSYYLLVKPFQILLIVVLAIALRVVVHRAISQLVRRTTESEGGGRGGLLRFQDTVFWERRRQRAKAIGSVLNSFAMTAIVSIAALMVLAQLGIDLAPLLASAGIAGLALGFGAQTLVKDLIAGLFMLLEDQYGLGDAVDLGQASGTVESVGLRTTSIRDSQGVLWHIRNGEIARVGNKSQGLSVVSLEARIGSAPAEEATRVIRRAVEAMAGDAKWRNDLRQPPQIAIVEDPTVEGHAIRVTAKTTTDAQTKVGRELRSRLTAALASAGITGTIAASRVYVSAPSEETPPNPTSGL